MQCCVKWAPDCWQAVTDAVSQITNFPQYILTCVVCKFRQVCVVSNQTWPLRTHHRLYKRNGRNIRDVTHWFVDCCSEANSFESRQRHLQNFRCMLGLNKNTDSTYMGMRRGHGRSGEVVRAGSQGHWSINLSITT